MPRGAGKTLALLTLTWTSLSRTGTSVKGVSTSLSRYGLWPAARRAWRRNATVAAAAVILLSIAWFAQYTAVASHAY